MAVVRELITTLGYKVDETGLKQYEAGFAKIKEMALGFAGALGIAFSAEKLWEFTKGLYDSGLEVNKIRAQIQNLARPMDDVNGVMENTFRIAQETGVAYTDILDTYKELLNVSQETKVSQDELLASTENIYKATKIDRATTEQTKELFQTLNRIFAMGTARPMMIGRIERISPTTLKMLEEHFKVTGIDQLRALAKAHQIHTEDIVKALSKMSPEMQRRFEQVPWTIGRGWEYMRNELVYPMAEFLKLARITVWLGTLLRITTDVITKFVQNLVKWFGGLRNLLEILGIAFFLVFGPTLISMLTRATAAMFEFAVATLAANWEWIAIAAAVVAAALAIQDFVYWIQGKRSLIGTWVGPFKDLQKTIMDAFGLERFQPILDFFSSINEKLQPLANILNDLAKADFSKAWEDSVKAWEQFTVYANHIQDLILGWTQTNVFEPIIHTWDMILIYLRDVNTFIEKWTGIDIFATATAGVNAMWEALKSVEEWFLSSWLGRLVTGQISIPLPSWLGGGAPGPAAGSTGAEADMPPEAREALRQQREGNGGIRFYLPSAPSTRPDMILPDVPPGALGPPRASNDNRDQSIKSTINNNNTFNIQGMPQDAIDMLKDHLGELSKQTADELTKQIVAASPRTEAATQ